MSALRPLLIAAPLVICSSSSIADEKSFAIHISSQPIPAALESLAQQTYPDTRLNNYLLQFVVNWRDIPIG